MRNVETIDREINELRKKMVSVKGTETEVYTRIVGYYRAVKNWNKGKRDEYNQRRLFSQPDKLSLSEEKKDTFIAPNYSESIDTINSKLPKGMGDPSKYIYFYRDTCPNCPPVKKWLGNFHLNGEAVNVDDETGFKKASDFQIFSSPTVIFTNDDGNEVFRATNTNALDELFAKATV